MKIPINTASQLYSKLIVDGVLLSDVQLARSETYAAFFALGREIVVNNGVEALAKTKEKISKSDDRVMTNLNHLWNGLEVFSQPWPETTKVSLRR